MGDLIYDAAELEAARVIAVMVPGALSRVDIFEAADAWRARGYGLVKYRFPGLDGRPVFPRLRIHAAAREIVELLARYPGKPVRLLGYSTGGPIVLTAAHQLTGDIKVAAMSSAIEGGGGLRTGLAGLSDIIGSAWRRGSLRRRDIWLEYYRVLLFGRVVQRNPHLAERANALITAQEDRIVIPDDELPRAHTDDLRRWKLPAGQILPPENIRFFIGMADPVFSQDQTLDFADRLGGCRVIGYPEHGHLLFLSCPDVFDDIFRFFEGDGQEQATGITLA